MSERKRSKRRKDEYQGPGEQQIERPTKEEIKVAKWMKKNVKTKKTKFLNHNIEYFTASKAIEALLNSKFAESSFSYFNSRETVVEFLDSMLVHKFFHRAKKVPINFEDLRSATTTLKGLKKDKIDKKEDNNKEKTISGKKIKDEKKNIEDDCEMAECSGNGNGDNDDIHQSVVDKKGKRKRKIRLDMHAEQVFVDGNDAYVWIYDPIPLHYWIFGFILLLGAIGICLFPLWPPVLRKGVYYLSLVVAGFFVFILILTMIRLIIFTIIWALTCGKWHFWIFPNLTEDVGFFASFWPLYDSKYMADEKSKKSNKRCKKSKTKDKQSDAEENEDTGPDLTALEAEKIADIKENDGDLELRHRNPHITNSTETEKPDTEEESHSGCSSSVEAVNKNQSVKCFQTPSESESDGKDYEIISSNEVQNIH